MRLHEMHIKNRKCVRWHFEIFFYSFKHCAHIAGMSRKKMVAGNLTFRLIWPQSVKTKRYSHRNAKRTHKQRANFHYLRTRFILWHFSLNLFAKAEPGTLIASYFPFAHTHMHTHAIKTSFSLRFITCSFLFSFHSVKSTLSFGFFVNLSLDHFQRYQFS